MLVCYLDDSDAEQSSVVTLAGYAQPISQWEAFEVHAEKVFARFGVTLLHGMKFHGTKDCFKGWGYRKKRDFIDSLYYGFGVMLGISHSVPKNQFRKNQKNEWRARQMSAYGYAFNAMVGGFKYSDFTRSFVEAEGLSFVVESGHKNNAELEKTFQALREAPGEERLRSLSFSGKNGSKAIQLADLFAFYSRRQAAKAIHLHKPSVEEAQKLEDKMYTLITSQCRHITVIMNEPLIGDWMPLDELEKKVGTEVPPGTHLFGQSRRPEDPE